MEPTEDVPGELDLNPTNAIETLDSWLDGFTRLLPNIAVAIVFFIVMWFVAKLAERLVNRAAARNNRNNLGEVMGSFLKWMIILVSALIALTIVVPTLKPGDLIAGMGIGSVAIGFAFKDILQNWLAGMLLLVRQPFETGDQIVVAGFEGVVEHIDSRATIIKTFDGRKIIIPNADLYTDAVEVNTAYDRRRNQYDIGIGYADNIEKAQSVILEAIKRVDGVLDDPAPQVLPWGLEASWVTLRARWWTQSQGGDYVGAYTQIILAVKNALDEAGIDMPYDTTVMVSGDPTGKPAKNSAGDLNGKKPEKSE